MTPHWHYLREGDEVAQRRWALVRSLRFTARWRCRKEANDAGSYGFAVEPREPEYIWAMRVMAAQLLRMATSLENGHGCEAKARWMRHEAERAADGWRSSRLPMMPPCACPESGRDGARVFPGGAL